MTTPWTRERFQAWLRSKEAPVTVIDPPYRIEPCACTDVNCHGWRLVPEDAPTLASDEEMVPHAFNSRTPHEPGDDRDIWCKDCEYHREHAIHHLQGGD
jgi:hypothetical protein